MFTVIISSLSFLAGYYVGVTDEKVIKEFFHNLVSTLKKSEKDIKEIIVDFLDELENLDSDEIKANFSNLLEIFKARLTEFLENEKQSIKKEIDTKNKKTKSVTKKK